MATRTNTSPVSAASAPSNQPQLRPEQVQSLLAGRRAAANQLQSAQTLGQEQAGLLRSNAAAEARQRVNQFDQITSNAMEGYGDRGLAFQPIGAGQGLRQIRDAEAEEAANAEYMLAVQLAEVAEQIAEARRQRDVTLGGLSELEQSWRSQMIRDQLENFRF